MLAESRLQITVTLKLWLVELEGGTKSCSGIMCAHKVMVFNPELVVTHQAFWRARQSSGPVIQRPADSGTNEPSFPEASWWTSEEQRRQSLAQTAVLLLHIWNKEASLGLYPQCLQLCCFFTLLALKKRNKNLPETHIPDSPAQHGGKTCESFPL